MGNHLALRIEHDTGVEQGLVFPFQQAEYQVNSQFFAQRAGPLDIGSIRHGLGDFQHIRQLGCGVCVKHITI